MNRDPLRAETERYRSKMHERARIGQTIGEVRLVTPEGMRALDRAPLAPPVADDDDQRRGLGPTGGAALLLHRFICRHLIRRMSQFEYALLLHPINEIRVDL